MKTTGYDPKLKEAAAEMTAICKKYDIGAYIMLASPTHTEFRFEIDPSWSAAFWEDKTAGKLRFRIKTSEIGKEKAKKIAEETCHMVFSIQDLCAKGFLDLQKMTEMLRTQMIIDHQPLKDFVPHKEH